MSTITSTQELQTIVQWSRAVTPPRVEGKWVDFTYDWMGTDARWVKVHFASEGQAREFAAFFPGTPKAVIVDWVEDNAPVELIR